jgi:predicted enzyme related to lactoylglutathione lyase
MGMQMAFLPMEGEGVGGALVQNDMYKPSPDGSLIYLNGGNNLSDPLGRVETAGGTVLMPKTHISAEIVHMAIFLDNQGNKVAFHSPN